MKKNVLTVLLGVSLASIGLMSSVSFAEDTTTLPAAAPFTVSADTVDVAINGKPVKAQQKDGQTTLISPRTGIRYVITNPTNRKVIFKTEELAAVNSATVGRIVASNPALSAQSQELAKQNLLKLTGATQ